VSRITPVHWKRLKCVFEHDGFQFSRRQRGGSSHWIGVKEGMSRPVVVPEYDEILLDIIQSNMRTARMSRERYLQLLAEC